MFFTTGAGVAYHASASARCRCSARHCGRWSDILQRPVPERHTLRALQAQAHCIHRQVNWRRRDKITDRCWFCVPNWRRRDRGGLAEALAAQEKEEALLADGEQRLSQLFHDKKKLTVPPQLKREASSNDFVTVQLQSTVECHGC